jgi:hypothetical protein
VDRHDPACKGRSGTCSRVSVPVAPKLPPNICIGDVGTAFHQVDVPRIRRVGRKGRWKLCLVRSRRIGALFFLCHAAHRTLTPTAVRTEATPRLAIARLSRRALFRSTVLDVLIISIWVSSRVSFVDASSDARKSCLIS